MSSRRWDDRSNCLTATRAPLGVRQSVQPPLPVAAALSAEFWGASPLAHLSCYQSLVNHRNSARAGVVVHNWIYNDDWRKAEA